MLGLNVVLHSLFVFICVRALQAKVFTIFTSGQFGRNQNIKGAFVAICSSPLHGHPCVRVYHARAIVISPVFVLPVIVGLVSVTFIQRHGVLLHGGGGGLLPSA